MSLGKRKVFSIQDTKNKISEILYEEFKYVFGPLAGKSEDLLDRIVIEILSEVDKILKQKETSLVGRLQISISEKTKKEFYSLVYCRIDISDIFYDYLILEGFDPEIDKIRKELSPFVRLKSSSSVYLSGEKSSEDVVIRVSVSKPFGGQSFTKTISKILEEYYTRGSTRYLDENILKMVMRYRKFKDDLKSIIGEIRFAQNEEKDIAKLFRKTVEVKINRKIPAILLLLGNTSIERKPVSVNLLIITRRQILYCIERYKRTSAGETEYHDGQGIIIKTFDTLDKSSFLKLMGSVLISRPDSWILVDNKELRKVL